MNQDEQLPRPPMDDRMASNEGMFTDDVMRNCRRKRSIGLSRMPKSRRSNENRDLAEVIEGCIRHMHTNRIRDLKWLLQQQELERPKMRQFPLQLRFLVSKRIEWCSYCTVRVRFSVWLVAPDLAVTTMV
jgi:hypothetical protein